jgi:transcriptional regulator with XRE-family HTH domain
MENIFGERLKELRNDKGISLKELSKLVYISDATLSRWENGITIADGNDLIKLAKFFHVSTDYLLGLE